METVYNNKHIYNSMHKYSVYKHKMLRDFLADALYHRNARMKATISPFITKFEIFTFS